MNLYDDANFVFNTAYDFKNRFAGEPDHFTPKTEPKGFLLPTNFVPDAVNLPLISAKERGAGGGHIRFNMAKGSMSSHISQFPVGTYKKAHSHGPSAHVIILSGEGYSLMWPEGEAPRRYDWQVGSMIVPPNKWFHQHFNSGPTPARYLAFKHEVALIRNSQGVPTAWISRRIGGDQIDYADETPEIDQVDGDEVVTEDEDEDVAAEGGAGPKKSGPDDGLGVDFATDDDEDAGEEDDLARPGDRHRFGEAALGPFAVVVVLLLEGLRGCRGRQDGQRDGRGHHPVTHFRSPLFARPYASRKARSRPAGVGL